MKLSAIVIAKNEERNLAACLATLKFANEIVVVDSGSSDKTIEIANQHTHNVFLRTFDNFGAQKNFAVSKSKGDWIIFLDADERVPEALAQEIIKSIQQTSDFSAFRIPRQTYFLGRRFRFSGTQHDRPVRLFKRGSGRFEQPIHEFYRCEGLVGDLDNVIMHYTTPTISVEKEKTEFYTSLEAKFLKEQGVKPQALDYLRPPLIFTNLYFKKFGFLDGLEGFWFAYYSAIYDQRKYQKLNELCRKENLEPKIQALFDDFAKNLPSRIDRSDSRLVALQAACGSVRGKKVLEVGCGKGRFANILIQEGAILTGVDPSAVLLESAKMIPGGTFLQCSASQLPFNDELFDIVYVVEVIGHLPLLERSITEMCRVLKKRGTLVIIDRNKFSFNQKRFFVPNYLIKRWHELKNQWIYPEGFPFRERWFSSRGLSKILSRACAPVTAEYIESDGEKKCAWHVFFDKIPIVRVFVLWKGIKK